MNSGAYKSVGLVTSTVPAKRSTVPSLQYAFQLRRAFNNLSFHNNSQILLFTTYTYQFNFVIMVSSKGKPTDPKLREEVKEGMFW